MKEFEPVSCISCFDLPLPLFPIQKYMIENTD